MFCSMPRIDLHVPRVFYGSNIRKLGMTGFVRDGVGCNRMLMCDSLIVQESQIPPCRGWREDYRRILCSLFV